MIYQLFRNFHNLSSNLVSKFLTLVIFLTFSLTASAQIRHIILDLENILIQQIPARNFQSFQQKEHMFSTQVNGRTAYYYIHWNAKDWLKLLLQREDIIVGITSDLDLTTTNSILEAISPGLRERIEGGLGKILTLESKKNNTHNLLQFTSDLESILFITHNSDKILPSQKKRALEMGEAYFKFESWETANTAAAQAGESTKKFFPANEKDWRNESYKIALLANLLKNSLTLLDTDKLRKKLTTNTDNSIETGKIILSGIKEQFFWIYSNDKITGCENINLYTEQKNQLPLSKCISSIQHEIEWKLAADKKNVESCILKSDKKISIDLPINDCISHKTKRYWHGNHRRNCVYYTDDLIPIAQASIQECSDKHILKNPFNQNYSIVTYFEGMEDKTLKEIFTTEPPSPDRPFLLYSPDDADKSVGFPKKCQEPKHQNHLVKADPVTGIILEECRPDTLYSWGPMIKIQDLKKMIGENAAWQGRFRTIFLSRSPLSTFGYGIYTIRVKLKKGVNWKIARGASCSDEDKNTVLYHPWGPGLDFAICSPDVIESWSYGQKEHYDEIIKDYLWFHDPKRVANDEIEAYANYGKDTVRKLFSTSWDRNNFSRATLNKHLIEFQKLVTNEQGEIFFNPYIDKKLHSEQVHFSTSKPIYFNER